MKSRGKFILSLFVSQYDTDDDGTENRIHFWLMLKSWTARESSLLFLAIDPNTVPLNLDEAWLNINFLTSPYTDYVDFDVDGLPEPIGYDEKGQDIYPATKLEVIGEKKLRINCLDILKRLNDKEDAEPKVWIERALKNKIDVPWLAFAIRKELLSLTESEQEVFTEVIDKNSPTFSVELYWAVRAWKFATDNQDKRTPKKRIAKWLMDNSGLSNEAIKRISVVGNWNKKGGAPKTGQNN